MVRGAVGQSTCNGIGSGSVFERSCGSRVGRHTPPIRAGCPRGDGSSTEKNLPVKWSATENVAWKAALPGRGHASPIVWQDQVFLVACLPERQERVLLCLDRRTGRERWRRVDQTTMHTFGNFVWWSDRVLDEDRAMHDAFPLLLYATSVWFRWRWAR